MLPQDPHLWQWWLRQGKCITIFASHHVALMRVPTSLLTSLVNKLSPLQWHNATTASGVQDENSLCKDEFLHCGFFALFEQSTLKGQAEVSVLKSLRPQQLYCAVVETVVTHLVFCTFLCVSFLSVPFPHLGTLRWMWDGTGDCDRAMQTSTRARELLSSALHVSHEYGPWQLYHTSIECWWSIIPVFIFEGDWSHCYIKQPVGLNLKWEI